MDDSATCFHGSGIYEDCNSRLWARNLMIRYAYVHKLMLGNPGQLCRNHLLTQSIPFIHIKATTATPVAGGTSTRTRRRGTSGSSSRRSWPESRRTVSSTSWQRAPRRRRKSGSEKSFGDEDELSMRLKMLQFGDTAQILNTIVLVSCAKSHSSNYASRKNCDPRRLSAFGISIISLHFRYQQLWVLDL